MGCSFLRRRDFPRGRVCYAMRAFVIIGPRQTAVEDVARPAAAPGQAVIDCSNAPELLALDLVEPGKRVVYVGLAGRPSLIDTRAMVLKDVTAVGILGGSHARAGAIEPYAAGKVDPRPLVAATVGLGDVGSVLAGTRPPGSGPGPKILIDPRR
jgi:threonine dehydrogenase-like Zn-dependent dehydrogenase